MQLAAGMDIVGDKPFSPACERNREPILAVLRKAMASTRRVLEIASGTGQHAAHFAAAMPWLQWQCSDVVEQLAGIASWQREAALPNLPPPIALDARDDPWPASGVDAVFSANTLHIIDWTAVEAFFRGTGSVLTQEGELLVVYGPFNYDGTYTSDSNRSFDAWLKARDPGSGIRDFERVDALARAVGLQLEADTAMPANNRCLLWRRS